MTPEAWAIARERAAQDRDTLARLVRDGKVLRRDGPYELRHPEAARPFIRDIERRARRSAINLAIRPNAKKKRRRR